MITRPKGTKDVVPSEVYKYQYFEKIAKEVLARFNFKEIRTPTFEHTELFVRGVGEGSDIVNKEMYTFKDKGDRSLTLKPEGTASIARAVIENGLDGEAMPLKLYSYTSCFRYERPQSGRFREHHQFSIEAYGSVEPTIDVEVMLMVKTVFDELNFKNYKLNINSIGCSECRQVYIEKLKQYYSAHVNELCDDCKVRLEKNPLRLLDCKNENCIKLKADAPKPIDFLCDDCRAHFNSVMNLLKASNVEFVVNPCLVRGLDYYTRTVFEFMTTEEGALGTICGGGRYDGLISGLGGKNLSGVGVGLGEERILMLLEKNNIEIPNENQLDIFVCSTDEEKIGAVLNIVTKLRNNGISADFDQCARSLKAQMKFANKIAAKFIMVIGEDELKTNVAQIKNMQTGETKSVNLNEIKNINKEILYGKN